MTVLVGISCTDGVVVGADGSATFTDGQQRTIEQPTKKKIEIVEDRVIVASSGAVGLAQRFYHVVQNSWRKGEFKDKESIDIGKMLSFEGIKDFKQTHLQQFDLSVLVACSATKKPLLLEFIGTIGFQPEIKSSDDLWYVSVGSGQPIVDPFLAFLRSVFWKDKSPKLREGIFITLWALLHACEVNPGGINEPIKIAVLERNKKGQLLARFLSEDELEEHRNMVASATDHMASFRDVVLGDKDAKMCHQNQTDCLGK